MPESGSVGDKPPFEYKLNILAKSHGIGLWFGEDPPKLCEPLLIIFLQHNSVMLY